MEAARRPGICPRPPGCRFDPRRDASLQPFSRSATVLAQERYSAVVMQSCGCQRPETILVIRVVRGFEHGNAALPFSRSAHVFAGSQPKLTCKSETDAMALSCFDSSQIFRFMVKPIDAQRQTAERAALVSSNECGRIVTARSGNKCRKPDKYHISRERQRSN